MSQIPISSYPFLTLPIQYLHLNKAIIIRRGWLITYVRVEVFFITPLPVLNDRSLMLTRPLLTPCNTLGPGEGGIQLGGGGIGK